MRRRAARARRGLAAGAALVLLAGPVPAALAVESPAPASSGRCGDPVERPWCDLRLPPDERADLLLAALTLDERISLLGGDEYFGVIGASDEATGTSRGVERVGLPDVYFSDGPVGPRRGPATGMPSPLNLAASFSPDVARRHAAVIGDEVKRKGADVVYAPAINILRTPVNGRTFEYFGEDPYLSGLIAEHWTKGVQAEGVIGNVKHYAANNQEGVGTSVPGVIIGVGVVGSRLTVDVRVDERTLREIYLPAFEAAVVDGGVGSVMCAYPRVNGSYACENAYLLTEVLKDDWEFEGFVLTDYGAAKSTAPSMRNGLDLDIYPGLAYSPTAVRLALASGQVTEAMVDEHVRRILRTLFAFGFFDRDAYVRDDARIDQDGHHEEAARIAAEGTVLLKNDDALLPLDEQEVATVAVIGPEADLLKDGGGSSAIEEFRTTTPLAALRERLGADRVLHDDGSDAARAAAVAASADVALVVVGDKMTEGNDKTAPTLNADQLDGIDRDALISEVAAAQPRTVAVLQAGGPVLTPWRDDVSAVLQLWYPGQNGGTAMARVLFGDVDPGGRLPATFPASAADLPTAGSLAAYPGIAETVTYEEGVLVGYRHFDARELVPAFPFGHGLSYTTFEHGPLAVTPGAAGADVVATARTTVTNTGTRAGYAVPQLYVGMPQPSAEVVQPPQQLKAVEKVLLQPGESRDVEFALDRRAFSYWDVSSDAWQVAPGCYDLRLASSSRDVHDQRVLGLGADCDSTAVPVARPTADAPAAAAPEASRTARALPATGPVAAMAWLGALLVVGLLLLRRYSTAR